MRVCIGALVYIVCAGQGSALSAIPPCFLGDSQWPESSKTGWPAEPQIPTCLHPRGAGIIGAATTCFLKDSGY